MKPLIPHETGIQERLAWVFGAFLLLVVISVVLTYWGLETERQNARVINLAGRQRMLIQQMARLSSDWEQEGDAQHLKDLTHAVNVFDQTLRALHYGGRLTDYTGQTLVLSPPGDTGVARSLEALEPAWLEFRSRIEQLLLSRTGARELEGLAPDLMDRADHLVQAYEAGALLKIARLHRLQIGFLISGLALLGLGWWVVQISVVRPTRQAERSAWRIGEGDLESPVAIRGPIELEQLGVEMERTRLQLLASRRELQSWVDTLEKRVEQRTAEFEALATVSREITSHLDIGTVLRSVTEKAQHLLGSEVAELCLLDARHNLLSLHASAGPDNAVVKGTSTVEEQTAAMLLQGQGGRICNAGTCLGFCEILDPAFRASHLAAPLRVADRVLGALCVGSSQGDTFRADALSLLTPLAGAAAVAIENSRLYEQAENVATLEERQRIGSEMHDGLLQTLSFLRWMAHMTEEQVAQGELVQAQEALKQIERANAQAESEIRRAISSLQENYPVHHTLQEQLAGMIAEMACVDPPVEFCNHVQVPLVFPWQEGEQALRVAREALLNAQRYSGAQHIGVSLQKVDGQLVLAVQDDGRGFDPGCPPGDDRPHFGIKIMQARAAHLGGRVQIDSGPGRGTRVALYWTPTE